MRRLNKADYGAVGALYRSHGAFFPLIAAVLLDEQDGTVYADATARPRRAYVEHAFGFAQVFGAPERGFDAALERYLLVDRAFAAAKVRLYTPALPPFLDGEVGAALRSERRRFVLEPEGAMFAESCRLAAASPIPTTAVDAQTVAAIESAFGVAGRFWRCAEDFAAKSLATVAWIDGEPAAICYAAAVADACAEIDVLTLPQYRRRGLGRLVAARFVEDCRVRGIAPLWDCFTNNAGSMALCRAAGFVPARPPYAMFTINR